MATMTVRSTYALDPETARLVKDLAGDWHVSQAEVIRRAVRKAALQGAAPTLSPADVVAHYRSRPEEGRREIVRQAVRDLRAMRRVDDEHRDISRSS